MANRRPGEVTYRPLRVDPVLQDGLLRVDRPDGGPERRVAEAFGRIASQADQIADDFAQDEGRRAGQRNALANGPRPSEISGGVRASAAGGTPAVSSLAPAGDRPSGASLPAVIGGTIEKAAARHGQDPAALKALAWIESRGDARARNPTSSAGGLFQFIDGTATAYGLRNRYNPVEASDAAARLMKDNAGQLRRALGRDPSPGELYLAHQQGAGGAVRLLRDPAARAVDVVGSDAVRLNGGEAGMSAGDFARLWTAKGDGAYRAFSSAPATALAASPPAPGAAAAIGTAAPREGAAASPAGTAAAIAPESVGPPSVTRVTVPMTARGVGGGFRPTGSMTLRGRAYDAAGTRTYLEQLDTTIRADADAVYARFKDDPAALDEAFDALRTVQMKDHVFPEIAADYDRAFSSVTRAYRTQARDDAERRVLQQDTADFLTRSQDMATMTARSVEAFDPSNADAGAAVASAIAASNALYDSAVARGTLDPVSAAEYKADASRRTATAYYLKQASVLTDADEVRALRDRMSADFAAGTMTGMDGEGWQDLDAKLGSLADQRLRQGEAAGRALEKRGDALAAGVARGLPADSAEVSQFMLDANSAPAGAEAVRGSLAKMRVAELLTSQELDTSETMVRALEQDPAAIQSGVAAFGRTMLDEARTKLAKDPIGYAVQRGMIADTPPIDPMAAPDAMAAAFASRAEAVENLQAAEPGFETAGALRPAEVDAFQRFWRAGSPEQIAAFTERMVAGLPPRVLRATLDQTGVKDVLKSAATGTDAHRNFEAMKAIGALAGGSGLMEVDRVFGGDVLDRYQDWESRTRYGTPEEAADFLKQRNDPQWQDRVKLVREAGRKKAREVSFDDIADGLDPTWFGADAPIDGATRRMMQNDFVQIYGDRYATAQDEGKAREQALGQMKAKGWGVSPALGGRIMFQPPEKYYPAIGNSHDWMKEELGGFAKERGVAAERLSLVPDAKTTAAIQRREPPTYVLSETDPETGLDRVLTDEQGRILRFGFDPKAAVTPAQVRANAKRARDDDAIRRAEETRLKRLKTIQALPGAEEPR